VTGSLQPIQPGLEHVVDEVALVEVEVMVGTGRGIV